MTHILSHRQCIVHLVGIKLRSNDIWVMLHAVQV